MPPLSVFACSACAGQYEDPDRTAGAPDELPEWEGDDAEPSVEGPADLRPSLAAREPARVDLEDAAAPGGERD